eukprot:GHVN01016130.1.p2 GENE.GHVN01016130.1~~GHVN01016130.1.p2  ORF type:complete len:287 (-),score=58.57 GHVN01016130.1:2076-2936(-)
MRASTVGALLVIGQLPLGLLRKKYRYKRDGKYTHLGFCVGALAAEIAAAAIHPVSAFMGLLMHVMGSRLVVVGITGGMGSGKSTLSRYIEQHGGKVIDADSIARQILEPGRPAHRHIIRCFGPAVVNEDRSINRTSLRELAFMSDANRRRLNQLTHMPIFREIMWEIIYYRLVDTHSVVVVDAPLLLESKVLKWLCSPIIVVDVTEATQRVRLQERDGHKVPVETLEEIARSQLSLEAKRSQGDLILDNNGELSTLYTQANYHLNHTLGINLTQESRGGGEVMTSD